MGKTRRGYERGTAKPHPVGVHVGWERIAVKVINHLGDEVMKVFGVG